MNSLRSFAAATLAALLVACGGGGDGGASGFIPPTDAFNVRAAWINLLTTTRSWSSISGRANDNHLYDVTVQIAPAAAALFPLTGTPANRSVQTVTSRIDGGAPSIALSELFVDAGSLWVGSRHTVDNAAPDCDEAAPNASQLPPTAVRFDANGTRVAGPLLAGTVYRGCANRGSALGSASATWSLEFEAGVTYFCVNTTDQDFAAPPNVFAEIDCIEVAPDGTLLDRVRITVRTGSFQLVARR